MLIFLVVHVEINVLLKKLRYYLDLQNEVQQKGLRKKSQINSRNFLSGVEYTPNIA